MKSSIGEAPRLAVSGDGVGGDEDLSHHSDEGDFAGLLMLDCQTVIEVFEWRWMADRGSRGVEENAANRGSSMSDPITMPDLAALLGQRCQADESGDLLAG